MVTQQKPDILEHEVKWASGNIATNKASGGDGIQAELMMLWKRCPQYASKFGKLSSGQLTGKGQVLSQTQRRAVWKNDQISRQLYSFHIRVRLYSKSFKLGFSSTWNKNFQMYKLALEKVEEPEIKLPTFVGS